MYQNILKFGVRFSVAALPTKSKSEFFVTIVNSRKPLTVFRKNLQAFFISNAFISNARLKLVKHQANAKQHSEAELQLFYNYSHSSTTLSSKIIAHILKNKRKSKCLFIHEITRLTIMKMKMKIKNRSHRYGKNRPRSRYGHKYSK